MKERKNISSGAKWEEVVGYSRAVRIGDTIEVSGTTAVEDGLVVFEGDLYGQTKKALEIIKQAIEEAGGTMNDVVRTRMYVTDISLWEAAAKAHAEFFLHIKPSTTMVEVKALIDPAMLIEIEATAIISAQ